ncbi:hypothetical protein [Sulfurisphaera tokodaii]|uniref:Transposase n=2 Tax=Sulfurisphaera tokodaii TaxID=111955 RepID=Q96XB9_SULTO|nr:hypothetical protein [Sulfurisphaera tokodaii]BAB67709.1 hypothetical protein STK_25960 [Sulfurisphaera tokodaii str. 7]HII75442.1 hypothetical protein [Sulfurisphaera tokodaii]
MSEAKISKLEEIIANYSDKLVNLFPSFARQSFYSKKEILLVVLKALIDNQSIENAVRELRKQKIDVPSASTVRRRLKQIDIEKLREFVNTLPELKHCNNNVH